LGGGLQAAHERDPYSFNTIDIRGVGDFSAARHLRDALEHATLGHYDEALRLCTEAGGLAPGYHEAARVEAYVHELASNFTEAFEAYGRAKDLAPEDPHVAYYFGDFLVRSGFDPKQGLSELQRSAGLDPDSGILHLTISRAHKALGSPREAMAAATYACVAAPEHSTGRSDAVFELTAACGIAAQQALPERNVAQLAEDVEFTLATLEELSPGDFNERILDLCLLNQHLLERAVSASEDQYIASKLRQLGARLGEQRRRSNPDHLLRRIGSVHTLQSTGGYGFLESGRDRLFFHASGFSDRRVFEALNVGALLAFRPGIGQREGRPRALDLFWVA
jgi:LuxR family glucitol operon transcriptional activator